MTCKMQHFEKILVGITSVLLLLTGLEALQGLI